MDISDLDGPDRLASGGLVGDMNWDNFEAVAVTLLPITVGSGNFLLLGLSAKSALAISENTSGSALSRAPPSDSMQWSIKCKVEHRIAAVVDDLPISAFSNESIGQFFPLYFETAFLKPFVSISFKLGDGALSQVEQNSLNTLERKARASGATLFASLEYSIISPEHMSPETRSSADMTGVWATIWPRSIIAGVNTWCLRSVTGKMCPRALNSKTVPVDGQAVTSSLSSSRTNPASRRRFAWALWKTPSLRPQTAPALSGASCDTAYNVLVKELSCSYLPTSPHHRRMSIWHHRPPQIFWARHRLEVLHLFCVLLAETNWVWGMNPFDNNRYFMTCWSAVPNHIVERIQGCGDFEYKRHRIPVHEKERNWWENVITRETLESSDLVPRVLCGICSSRCQQTMRERSQARRSVVLRSIC